MLFCRISYTAGEFHIKPEAGQKCRQTVPVLREKRREMEGKEKDACEWEGGKQKRMKKKNLVISLALLVLILTAGVYTAYAYLTAQDDVENTFDAAEVDVSVDEDFEPEPPGPGSVIKKAPRVHSHSDTDCYVRMRYVFTDSDAEALCEPVEINRGWSKKADGCYYWNGSVGPGEETGTLFDRIQIKSGIGKDDIPPFDILVYAEAVQAGGMTEEEAWASMD